MAKSGSEGSDESEKSSIPESNNEMTSTNTNPNNVIARVKLSTQNSILIESLVKNLCHIYEPDPKKVELIYNIICDKLFKMNCIDESYAMSEFESIRAEYQKALHLLLKSSIGSSEQTAVGLRPVWPSQDWFNSHYYREFDEVAYIAGGGFGQVFRVKHKLDGSEYAVKKIPIQSEGITAVRGYLSEVKTFASVNHSNIVQYKAAWLELGAPASDHLIIESTDESDSLSSPIASHIDDNYIYHQNADLSFSNHADSDSDFEVNFEHSIGSLPRAAKRRVKRNSVSEGGKAVCKLDLKEIEAIRNKQKAHVKWATLYIQMALCQSTLKQWLESRNDQEESNKALVVIGDVRNETIYTVLGQLLKGIEYIHSKGIVHHDVKPSNIFIQLDNGQLLVQLGDFGLACPLQNARHSLAFGTKLYAAPEQLAGKCDPKSDMYSLGIVLYELVERFRTDMERVHYIEETRKGKLPPHIHIQYPQLSQIITQLVAKSPTNRPNASSLLKTIGKPDHGCQTDKYVQELEDKLAERDEEILRLKEMLKLAGVKSI